MCAYGICRRGQLWHILRTAVSHFLFSFQINFSAHLSRLEKKKNTNLTLVLSFPSHHSHCVIGQRERVTDDILSYPYILAPPIPSSFPNFAVYYFYWISYCVIFNIILCKAWRNMSNKTHRWPQEPTESFESFFSLCFFFNIWGVTHDIHHHRNMFSEKETARHLQSVALFPCSPAQEYAPIRNSDGMFYVCVADMSGKLVAKSLLLLHH